MIKTLFYTIKAWYLRKYKRVVVSVNIGVSGMYGFTIARWMGGAKGWEVEICFPKKWRTYNSAFKEALSKAETEIKRRDNGGR